MITHQPPEPNCMPSTLCFTLAQLLVLRTETRTDIRLSATVLAKVLILLLGGRVLPFSHLFSPPPTEVGRAWLNKQTNRFKRWSLLLNGSTPLREDPSLFLTRNPFVWETQKVKKWDYFQLFWFWEQRVVVSACKIRTTLSFLSSHSYLSQQKPVNHLRTHQRGNISAHSVALTTETKTHGSVQCE